MQKVLGDMQEPTKAAAEIHQILSQETTHETVVGFPTTITLDSAIEQKKEYFWNCVYAVSSSS